MGVEDATVLADALLNNPPDASGDVSFDAAWTEYATRRVPRSKKVDALGSYSKALTMADRWWWRWLRDISSRIPISDPKTYDSLHHSIAIRLSSSDKPSSTRSWLVDSSQDWLFKNREKVELRDDRRHFYEHSDEGLGSE